MEDSGAGFPIEPPRGSKNGFSHSTSMIHPNAIGAFKSTKQGNEGGTISGTYSHSQHDRSIKKQGSQKSQVVPGLTSNDILLRQATLNSGSQRTRIHCSGPLVPPGGNMEDMLKEHERQIREAVRKARLEKERTKKNLYAHEQSFHQGNFGYR